MQKVDETFSVIWAWIYWKWSDLGLSDGNPHSQNPASLVNTGEYCQWETGTCQEHCQQLDNNNKDVCHLPLWRMNLLALRLSMFNLPCGTSGCIRALCAPGNLVDLVWRELAVFRNWFHDSNPCISSYLCVMGLVTQLYPTLCDPMDCSPPGSSVYGDSPGKNTSGFPCPPPGDLLNLWIKPRCPAFSIWVIREAPSYPQKHYITARWHRFLMTGRNAFCQVSAWLHWISYTHLPPPPLGAVSQSYLRCYLPGYSPHFASNET